MEISKVSASDLLVPWSCWLLSVLHPRVLQNSSTNDHVALEGCQVCMKACEEAFQALKKFLISAPVLAQPDIARPFDVYCDASRTGLGYVLMQGG